MIAFPANLHVFLACGATDMRRGFDGLAAQDGRFGIDNNPAERSLRGIALTRKNFLFLGSEAGGTRAAILYSVLESAKLNGLDPEAYLAGVIAVMARGHPIDRLDELLPWKWAPQPHRMAA